jgi:DNA invertase Pin-like site-specific DNA recombinase
LAKALIQRGPSGVRCLFIDELWRASRDAVEALHLGRLIELSGKRIVGATDGFDSANTASKMQLHVYAMIHELFVDQLREKVRRGMRDAFEQGRNLHPPAVGYKLVPVLDEHDRAVLDEDGRPMTERVIDPDAAPSVREAFELYADRSWSRDRIARQFNERAVGGTRTWDSTRVKQLLERSTYRGVEFHEMTYQVRDPGSGGVTVKRRPPSEWKRRDVPHLRIVPDDLWERAAARLAKSKEVYDTSRKAGKPSRTELHHKTLARPVCGVCGKPLWLGRSGKYASYFCLQGKDGKDGCTLTGYKSARIVENAVIGRVAQEVLTDTFVAELVEGRTASSPSNPTRPGPRTRSRWTHRSRRSSGRSTPSPANSATRTRRRTSSPSSTAWPCSSGRCRS